MTAANCLYISDFWGLRPQTPTGAPPLDRAGGLPSPRQPCVRPDFRAWLRHCVVVALVLVVVVVVVVVVVPVVAAAAVVVAAVTSMLYKKCEQRM